MAEAVGKVTFKDGCLAAEFEEGDSSQTFAVIPVQGSRVVEKDGGLGLELGRTVIAEGDDFVNAASSYRVPTDAAGRRYVEHCGASEIMFVMTN